MKLVAVLTKSVAVAATYQILREGPNFYTGGARFNSASLEGVHDINLYIYVQQPGQQNILQENCGTGSVCVTVVQLSNTRPVLCSITSLPLVHVPQPQCLQTTLSSVARPTFSGL